MHRVRADNFARILDFNAEQSRRVGEKRLGRNSDARSEDPAHVFPARGDNVEIDRRAEVHHDARPAVLRKCGHAVHNPVGAHFLWILIQHWHAGFHSRLDEQRLHVKIPLRHFFQRGIEWRHHRTDDHAGDRGRVNFRQSKKLACEDAVFIDGLVARRRQSPVRHEFRFPEQSQDRIRVPDVER